MSEQVAELVEAWGRDLAIILTLRTILENATGPLSKQRAEDLYASFDLLERLELTHKRQINDANEQLRKANVEETNSEKASPSV